MDRTGRNGARLERAQYEHPAVLQLDLERSLEHEEVLVGTGVLVPRERNFVDRKRHGMAVARAGVDMLMLRTDLRRRVAQPSDLRDRGGGRRILP